LLQVKEVETLGQFLLEERQLDDPEAHFLDTTLEGSSTDDALRRRWSRHLDYMQQRLPHWTSADAARYLELQGYSDLFTTALEDEDISVSY